MKNFPKYSDEFEDFLKECRDFLEYKPKKPDEDAKLYALEWLLGARNKIMINLTEKEKEDLFNLITSFLSEKYKKDIAEIIRKQSLSWKDQFIEELMKDDRFSDEEKKLYLKLKYSNTSDLNIEEQLKLIYFDKKFKADWESEYANAIKKEFWWWDKFFNNSNELNPKSEKDIYNILLRLYNCWKDLYTIVFEGKKIELNPQNEKDIYGILLRLYKCWEGFYTIIFNEKKYEINPYLYWPINEMINWPEKTINLEEKFNFDIPDNLENKNKKKLEKELGWINIKVSNKIFTKIEILQEIFNWYKKEYDEWKNNIFHNSDIYNLFIPQYYEWQDLDLIVNHLKKFIERTEIAKLKIWEEGFLKIIKEANLTPDKKLKLRLETFDFIIEKIQEILTDIENDTDNFKDKVNIDDLLEQADKINKESKVVKILSFIEALNKHWILESELWEKKVVNSVHFWILFYRQILEWKYKWKFLLSEPKHWGLFEEPREKLIAIVEEDFDWNNYHRFLWARSRSSYVSVLKWFMLDDDDEDENGED